MTLALRSRNANAPLAGHPCLPTQRCMNLFDDGRLRPGTDRSHRSKRSANWAKLLFAGFDRTGVRRFSAGRRTQVPPARYRSRLDTPVFEEATDAARSRFAPSATSAFFCG
jgi:hypothetical protein